LRGRLRLRGRSLVDLSSRRCLCRGRRSLERLGPTLDVEGQGAAVRLTLPGGLDGHASTTSAHVAELACCLAPNPEQELPLLQVPDPDPREMLAALQTLLLRLVRIRDRLRQPIRWLLVENQREHLRPLEDLDRDRNVYPRHAVQTAVIGADRQLVARLVHLVRPLGGQDVQGPINQAHVEGVRWPLADVELRAHLTRLTLGALPARGALLRARRLHVAEQTRREAIPEGRGGGLAQLLDVRRILEPEPQVDPRSLPELLQIQVRRDEVTRVRGAPQLLRRRFYLVANGQQLGPQALGHRPLLG